MLTTAAPHTPPGPLVGEQGLSSAAFSAAMRSIARKQGGTDWRGRGTGPFNGGQRSCHVCDVPELSPPLPSRGALQACAVPLHHLARDAAIGSPLPPGRSLLPAAVQPGSLTRGLLAARARLKGARGGLAGAMALALGLSTSGACPGPTCSSSAGSSFVAGWQGASLRAACLAPWRCTRTAPRRRRQQVRAAALERRGAIAAAVAGGDAGCLTWCSGQSKLRMCRSALSLPCPLQPLLRAALLDPPAFDPDKLRVEYLPGAREAQLAAGRRYTLTHNDVTGSLQLAIGARR